MTTTVIGSFSIGQILPTTLTAFGSVEADLNAQLAVDGGLAVSLTATLPDADIAAEASAAFAASFTEPDLSASISANFDAIADIQFQLSLLAGIALALGTAGVVLVASDTTLNAMGSELTSAVASGIPGAAPTDNVKAISLIATTPAAWAALATLVKTS
jgi:hypothetical protein